MMPARPRRGGSGGFQFKRPVLFAYLQANAEAARRVGDEDEVEFEQYAAAAAAPAGSEPESTFLTQ